MMTNELHINFMVGTNCSYTRETKESTHHLANRKAMLGNQRTECCYQKCSQFEAEKQNSTSKSKYGACGDLGFTTRFGFSFPRGSQRVATLLPNCSPEIPLIRVLGSCVPRCSEWTVCMVRWSFGTWVLTICDFLKTE